MAKKVSKPSDSRISNSGHFSWDSFIHSVTNGNYVLVLGSEVMLSKTIDGNYNGDSTNLIFDDVRSNLVSKNILSPDYAAKDFSQLAYHIRDIDTHIRESVNTGLDFLVEEMEPKLIELMRTKMFRVVLTTCFDPYVLRLMEEVWGKGNVRIMNINSQRHDNEFDFERYVLDDTVNPLPPTLYYIFGKAFPDNSDSRFVVTDNDAIETVSKWMGKDAPQKFLSYIRSKRILALGCKFDDWYFRFFWYILKREIGKLGEGEVAITLDAKDRSESNLKKFLYRTRVYTHGDARLFMKDIIHTLTSTSPDSPFRKQIISYRRKGGIFISYCSKDVLTASQLFFMLRKKFDNVWFDNVSLYGGDNYNIEIEQAIQSCKVFVPVLTPHIAKDLSNGDIDFYYNKEWRMAAARREHLKIIPVAANGYDLRGQYHCEGFEKIVNDQISGIDLVKPDGYNRLIEAIDKYLIG